MSILRAGTHDTFPLLRRTYESADEIGKIINRNRITVFRKLAYNEFTQRDKELIAKDLIDRGIEEDVKDIIQKYFGG